MRSYDQLSQENERLHQQVRNLEQQLEWFKRQIFGPTSEKRYPDPPPEQLSLGEMFAPKGRDETIRESVKGYTRRKSTSSEESQAFTFDESVPIEYIDVPNPALEGLSSDDFTVISEKKTYRLAQRPGSAVILCYRRKVVKRYNDDAPSCPALPEPVLGTGSRADVSFLAGLVVDKFVYHLPLYRQYQRLAAQGITYARTNLTHHVHQIAQLLAPIVDAQLKSILKSSVLAMDETPIKAGRKKGQHKMKTGYYWPLYGDQDEIAFLFSPSHGFKAVQHWLDGVEATLLTDGYGVYAKVAATMQGITAANCWSHSRREFIKAETSEPEHATGALERIGRIYEHEEIIRQQGLTGEAKRNYRLEQSKPIVEEFFAWADQKLNDHGLLPTNPFTKALNYVRSRKSPLMVFLEDPDVAVDTNHLERALRVIPMGRKNWVFCWTEVGAEVVGGLQSLLTTCRLHGVDPYDYLVDVLQRISLLPAKDVHLLTPRLWKAHFAHQRLTSDIEKVARSP